MTLDDYRVNPERTNEAERDTTPELRCELFRVLSFSKLINAILGCGVTEHILVLLSV